MAFTPTNDGYEITSDACIDRRFLLTKQEMLEKKWSGATKKFLIPNPYFVMCSEDKCFYIYSLSNPESPETGYFAKYDMNPEEEYSFVFSNGG